MNNKVNGTHISISLQFDPGERWSLCSDGIPIMSALVVGKIKSQPRVLIVCTLFTLAYRTLRCVHAAGAQVFVLGNSGSIGFRYSRFCSGFFESHVQFSGVLNQAVADEINRYVELLGIDVVLAGDAPSTRTVVGLKDEIKGECFPGPEINTFDALNDKWAFTGLCRELGILCPKSRLFTSRTELLQEIDRGQLRFPAIVKPLALEGGHGIVKLAAREARLQVEAISYAPILVQDFVEGEDIGASVYAENGIIRAFILHHLKRAVYTTFEDSEVRVAIAKIIRRMNVSGIFNFDMRMSTDRSIYYLECNPRVFFKINLSMLAGLNFVGWGLYGVRRENIATVPSGTRVLLPKALALASLTPWRLRGRDFAVVRYLAADPIPYLRELLKLEWEP